jgi:hypothetical protein
VNACWCCQARQDDVLAVFTGCSALHGNAASMRTQVRGRRAPLALRGSVYAQ